VLFCSSSSKLLVSPHLHKLSSNLFITLSFTTQPQCSRVALVFLVSIPSNPTQPTPPHTTPHHTTVLVDYKVTIPGPSFRCSDLPSLSTTPESTTQKIIVRIHDSKICVFCSSKQKMIVITPHPHNPSPNPLCIVITPHPHNPSPNPLCIVITPHPHNPSPNPFPTLPFFTFLFYDRNPHSPFHNKPQYPNFYHTTRGPRNWFYSV
jgi:hypothetical protein